MPHISYDDLVHALTTLIWGPGPRRRVRVPDVVGKRMSVASAMLGREGLRIVTEMAVAAPRAVEGVVVLQSIAPNRRVRRGTTVELLLDFQDAGRS